MAASVGLHLDPWQRFALEVGLGESTDGQWSAFETAVIVSRQNGKGSLFEALTLAKLFLFGDELIIYSAHEFKTAKEAFRRLSALMEHPNLAPRVERAVRNPSEFGFDLRSGQRVRFFARTSGSGRGWTADTLILDEAYRLNGDAMAALLPTLSTRPNPQVWYGSSAAMESSEQLHAVRRRALDGASPRLAYLEWSAPEDCDPGDPAMWALANPAMGYRMTAEFVAAEFAALPLPEFRRERLSIPDEPLGSGVIPLGVWATRAVEDDQRPAGPRFALDVTPERTAAAICVAGKREDGLLQVEVAEHRDGVDWVVARMVELDAEWGRPGVVVDGSSAAASLVTDLEAAGVTVMVSKPRDLMVACGQFYDAVMNAGLRQVPDVAMTQALAGATKRPLGDAWVWNRRNTGFDISPLVAATLALWSAARGVTLTDEELLRTFG